MGGSYWQIVNKFILIDLLLEFAIFYRSKSLWIDDWKNNDSVEIELRGGRQLVQDGQRVEERPQVLEIHPDRARAAGIAPATDHWWYPDDKVEPILIFNVLLRVAMALWFLVEIQFVECGFVERGFMECGLVETSH